MQRPIIEFHQDDEGDWVAELSCGHARHVRHDPPREQRAWVLDEKGRRSMLGRAVDCPHCDALKMPEDARPLRETPVFTADSIPEGLKRRHITATGVWGRILVLEGRLRYVIDGMADRRFDLTPESPGIVPPETEHHVEVTGPVRFKVAFFETGRRGGESS